MKKSSRPKVVPEEITCAICLNSLINKQYATADHNYDATTKCCPNCLKKWFVDNDTSLIARVPINSYTIYSSSGKPVKQIPIKSKTIPMKQFQQFQHIQQIRHTQIDIDQKVVPWIWFTGCVFIIVLFYWLSSWFNWFNKPLVDLF